MNAFDYFSTDHIVLKKKYDALRAFNFEGLKAEVVAKKYGYTLSAFYSLNRDFNKFLKQHSGEDYFFKRKKPGTRPLEKADDLNDLIIGLRKKNFSAEQIVSICNSKGHHISYGYVYQLLKKEGFARLTRRSRAEKQELTLPRKIKASVSQMLQVDNERFQSTSTGLLCFLPILKKYGIDRLIASSDYPQTKTINRVSSILSFVALKLSDIRRYSNDELWCMDRGLGLFAGLNVLPKNAWLSSYSSRVTRGMNVSFLKQMHNIWVSHGLLSDTSNLDFTTIPYWGGQDDHLENNWSGKRNKALSSMLAVLAHDPDSGIIDYGDTNVLHRNESAVVLEYLDFYRQGTSQNLPLKYLVFDSKFTNYENLSKIDDENIKFVTIRRRGKNMVSKINNLPKKEWTTIRVEGSGLKKRTLKVVDQYTRLRGYNDTQGKPKAIRQLIITGHGKIKPAIILTNDNDLKTENLVRKYCKRWLVEKAISEQIDFFHLNRLSSSMVIKVDFDFTMTLLAHNLYRLFAQHIGRYEDCSDMKIYQKFILNAGGVSINDNQVTVELKKKRELPQLIQLMQELENYSYEWIENRTLNFIPSATS